MGDRLADAIADAEQAIGNAGLYGDITSPTLWIALGHARATLAVALARQMLAMDRDDPIGGRASAPGRGAR